jgi:hypothetical protein
VRALRSGRRLDVAIAAIALVGGYFVRQKQFTSLPVGNPWADGVSRFLSACAAKVQECSNRVKP